MELSAVSSKSVSIPVELSIETRSGLPEEWRFLYHEHPKDGWISHSSLGEHTRFWLSIHRHFRMNGVHLLSQSSAYREGKIDGNTFRQTMAPRLQQFLQTLDHHHRIEDQVFFPKFTAAENRLAKAIDLLEADHEVIDAEVHHMVQVANTLLQVQASDSEGLKRSGEAFANSSERIVKLLGRHLDDEEEIVVPLMLDRGEVELMGE